MQNVKLLLLTFLTAIFLITGCSEDSSGGSNDCKTGNDCSTNEECRFSSLDDEEGICVSMKECTTSDECNDGRECNEKLDTSYCGYTDQPFGVVAATLPEGYIGESYSFNLEVKGSGGTYYFELKDGSSLPQGLSINSQGEITGTPAEAVVNHPFIVIAINGSIDASYYYNYKKVEKSFVITVNEGSSDPCDPNPCTDTNKTVCTDDNGTAVCSCDEGFSEDQNGDCIEDVVDPCDPNPCTDDHRTVCNADGENYTCECDTDYVLENNECINSKTVDCTDVAPDNGTSTIEQVEITYTTADGWSEPANCDWSCDRGYEEVNGVCEEIDLCDPNPCTETNRTVCSSDGESFTCSCDLDYVLEGDQCINSKLQNCTDVAPTNGTSNIVEVEVTYTTADGWSTPANCEWSCDDGFENVEGACLAITPCDPNPCTDDHRTVCVADGENYTCSCDTDYTLEGDQCINTRMENCIDVAPDDATSNIVEVEVTYTTADGWTTPANCEWSCDDGFIEDNGTCVEIPSCPSNMQLVNNECVCYPGYAGDDCTECEDGYIMNGGLCIIDCSADPLSEPAEDNLSCQCVEDAVVGQDDNCFKPCDDVVCSAGRVCELVDDMGATTCVCDQDAGLVDNNGVCECEGVNEVLNGDSDGCICDTGYVRNLTGVCVVDDGTCSLDQYTQTVFDNNGVVNSELANSAVLPNNNATYENLTTEDGSCAKVEDWYKLELVPAGTTVTVTINFVDENGDLDLNLKDSEGTTIDTSAGTTDTESVQYSVTEEMDLYIRVYYGQNAYSMDISFTTGDPCESVECGMGEVCNLGECICDNDSGYYSNGYSCVNPCESVTCQENSTCLSGSATETVCICDDGYTELAGECIMPTELNGGDICEQSVEITEMGLYMGTTTTAADDISDSTCGSATGAEVVYHYTPTEDKLVNFSLGMNTTFDSVLYVRTDCGDTATQIGCSDTIGDGGEEIEFIAEAGVTYYIFIDGYSGENGDYELIFDIQDSPCNGCNPDTEVCGLSQGEWGCQCAEGYYEDENGECVTPCDQPNACPDETGNGTGECLAVSLNEWMCGCTDGYYDQDDNGTHTCVSPCEPNPCDGIQNGTGVCNAQSSSTYSCECDENYDFSMEGDVPTCSFVGAEGAEACSEDAPVIDHSGVWSGDTSDNTNDHELKAGNDVVYMLTLTEEATVELWLHSESYDTYLYLADNCAPISTADVIAYNDDSSTYGTSTRNSVVTELLTAGTYYVFVDGYSSTANGDYQLTVTITPENTDPCGGACEEWEVCNEATSQCDLADGFCYDSNDCSVIGAVCDSEVHICGCPDGTYLNEAQTECLTPLTIDWCNVQYPDSITANVDDTPTAVYSQVYSSGNTESQDEAFEQIVAQMGYTYQAFGEIAYPIDDTSFVWVDGSFNLRTDRTDNNHEYMTDFPTDEEESFYYIYRVSGDGGTTWTYCDRSGVVAGTPVDAGTAVISSGGVETYPANGDFETWDQGVISDWTMESGIEVTQDTVNFHSGSSSAILTRTGSSNGDVEITSAYIPVVADTAYHISAWFLDMTSLVDGRIAVEWFDADMNYVSNYYGSYTNGEDGNTDWEELTADQTAPSNAAYMRVFFRVYGTTGGSVNIDNVTVTAQ